MRKKSKHPLRVYAPGERRGNPTCIIKGRLADGRAIERALETTDPAEARCIADEYYRAEETAAREQSCAPAGPATFRELAARYKLVRRVTKHEGRYIDKLAGAPLQSLGGRRLGDVALEHLTPALAQEAAGALYGRRCAKTMNRAAINPFSAVVHFANENAWMPYLRVKGFKVVDRLTPRLAGGEADVRRLLAAAAAARPKKCDRYKADHPYRYILLLFLFRQGWRITETLRLTWDQIDLPAGVFRAVEVDKGNAVKNRLVMHPSVFEAFAGLPEGEPERADSERHGRVFPWVNRHNVYRWLNPFCEEVGIHFRPHMARVEFASQLNESGQTDTKIKDVCTWTDTRSIARYTRTSEAECEATIALVGQQK